MVNDYKKITTVVELFERSVALYGNNPLVYEKKGESWVATTYKEVKQEAQDFGAGLLAMGLEKGDRVALLSEGRKDWLVAELGMFYAGMVNVPLSVKLDAGTDISFRIEHSGARLVIVSPGQAAKAEQVLDVVPTLEKVVYFDNCEENERSASFEKIKERGAEWLKEEANATRFAEITASLTGDDLANISYTSGTTADPKGIMLSQRNYAANTLQSCSIINFAEKETTLTILPWDHSFAHTACLYCMVYYGASLAAQEVGRTPIETLKNIPKNIKEVRPHLMMSVPAISKSFRKNIEAGIKAKGATTEKLFKFFLRMMYIYNGDGSNTGKGFRALLWPLKALGDKLIFSKVRENFGGRLRYFIGGGALLDIELQRFFAAVGIPIMQGYGLSEASPVISANTLPKHRFGSSGILVKYLDVTIRDGEGNILPIGEKGEIVIKGDNVMKGYWRNETATAESIKDGWLYTGDMGYLTKDGFLYVLGRFKSLLIGSDGEKYSPEGIEESMVELSPLIDQCMLYNNQNAYTTAFLVPNVSALKAELKAKGSDLSTETGRSMALEMIQTEVNKFKTGGEYGEMFPDRWLPAAVVVLPEAFTEQNKMLNSTMKMVRGKVTDRYQKELDFLYTASAKNIDNEVNQENLKAYIG